jgi:F1F0 ATPase subunit 2
MNVQALRPLTFLVLGAVVGGTYFRALGWNVRLYCRGSSIPLALSIHLLRFLAAGAIFVAIARTGAAPLLCTLVGFQLTRLSALGAKVLPSETVL